MSALLSIAGDGAFGAATLALAPQGGCLGLTLTDGASTLSIGLSQPQAQAVLQHLVQHLMPGASPGVVADVTALRLRAMALAKGAADPRGALLVIADYAQAAAVHLGLGGLLAEAEAWTRTAEALREDARLQPQVPAI